jgi:hypothetical protein
MSFKLVTAEWAVHSMEEGRNSILVRLNRQEWKNLKFKIYYICDSKASFTHSGFQLAGRFQLSPDKVVEHRKAWVYSHDLVICLAGNLPAGCWVAPRAICYYVRSLAGSWVTSGAPVPSRHVHTLRFFHSRPNDRDVCMLSYVTLLCPVITGTFRLVENRNLWTEFQVVLLHIQLAPSQRL